MDRQEFIQNLERVKRRKILLIRLGASLLFVTLCSSMWLSKTHPSALGMFKMVAIAIFAAMAYTFITTTQSLSRRLGLHCPGCGRNLSGPMSHKVLSTDQCFQCGMKLF